MGNLVAKIAISKAIYAIDKPYDYVVPEELASRLEVGMRVLVPFGKGDKGCEGLILGLEKLGDSDKKLKAIKAQLDETPVLNQEGVRIAIWMRSMYYCTFYDCVRAILPAGLFFALKDYLILDMEKELARERVLLHPLASKLLELLIQWDGEAEVKRIHTAFGTKNANSAIRFLLEQEIVCLESNAQRKISDKSDKVVSLCIPPEEAMERVAPKRKQAPSRYAVVELMCQVGTATNKELSYYTGASDQTISNLVKMGILSQEKEEVLRSPHKEEVEPEPKPLLSEEQEMVFHGLREMLGQTSAALLYGVTGSGKTQVYISLIHETLAKGKTAMVLVPEIILTPQLLRIFSAQFGEKIAILHSGLHIGERYDEWKRVKRGDVSLVLGTRSAVFAPLENIGVIILDEEQEASYKSEQNPRYHTREVAKYRCARHKCLLVLGSATPSIDSMYQAQREKYRLFTLKQRYNQGGMPNVTIVDMKAELKEGRFSSVSLALAKEIRQNVRCDEQSILFLNRRGRNRMLTCGECGFVPECPKCDMRLTYHSANERLMCHYCNYSSGLLLECPVCGSGLSFVGIGTQQVESDLKEYFPKREVLRMDTDTINAKNSHEMILTKFREEKVPILVGTQMVAKGLDFENVTLVGVVSADLSLYVDDLWASERTFSLITQVVGRAGRGGKQGRAVIQTYTPDNDVIVAAAQQDYDKFYQQEIILRQLRQYPPFREVIVVVASGMTANKVVLALKKFSDGLHEAVKSFEERINILGPAPASVPKVNGRFRYHLTLITQHSEKMKTTLAQLLTLAQLDKESKTVSIYIDRLLH